MNFTSELTRAERMKRIGELLAKGITILLVREAQEKEDQKRFTSSPQQSPSSRSVTDCQQASVEDGTGAAVLAYLQRVGSASPRDVQRALSLSKATAFRRLNELLQIGEVLRFGKTTAVRYRAVMIPASVS